MQTRYDYGSLKIKKTDEGFVLDSPIVGRTGILEYRNADGSMRRELRLPEDVFHADSLASFEGKLITVGHPAGIVNKKNYKSVAIGTMLGASKLDDQHVQARVVIHEPEKIGENRELSLGYNVDLDETPGEWNGLRYDAIQRNIRVNHLSVVKRGRAGSIARLNVDSNEEIDIQETNSGVKMAKLKLDNNCEYDVPQEVIAGYDKMKTDHAAANTALETVNKTVQTLTGERDTLKARVDGIDAEIAKKVAEGVTKARADETEAARVKAIGAAYKVDCEGKDIKAIKVLVLKSYNKDFKEDGKSDDYINAAFDMVPFKTDAVNAPVLNNAIAAQRLAVQAVQQTEKKDAVDPYDAYMATLGSNAAKA